MSGYGSMQASPFWKVVMRITGILCFVTLMTPPLYYLKYVAIDRPAESAAAHSSAVSPPVQFRYIDLMRSRATDSKDSSQRIQAVDWLSSLVLSPGAQITHPVECLYAKLAIGNAAQSDRDADVRTAASNDLERVSAKGAVIKR